MIKVNFNYNNHTCPLDLSINNKISIYCLQISFLNLFYPQIHFTALSFTKKTKTYQNL